MITRCYLQSNCVLSRPIRVASDGKAGDASPSMASKIHRLQQFARQVVNARTPAFTWACDIERFDAVIAQPSKNIGCRLR